MSWVFEKVLKRKEQREEQGIAGTQTKWHKLRCVSNCKNTFEKQLDELSWVLEKVLKREEQEEEQDNVSTQTKWHKL